MPHTIDLQEYNSKIKRVLITEEELKAAIKKAGPEIDRYFDGYPLLLVSTDQVSTDLRSAFQGVGLLVAMAIPVYGLNLLWDTNFMFLMRPDSGNPLELFEKLLGSHLWGFPILLPIVILIMYIPIFLLKKHKSRAKR